MHSIPVAKTKEEGLIKQEKKKEVLDAAQNTSLKVRGAVK
jgi:hypothetical protein